MLLSSKAQTFTTIFAAVLLAALWLGQNHESFKSSSYLARWQTSTTNALHNNGARQSAIHLVFPVTAPNAGFCRTLLSAFLAGYETPILVNWGGASNGSHIAKIGVMRELLETSHLIHDDDYVLLTDAHDVVFQLPASLLAHRIRQKGIDMLPIFGADKHCFPHPENAARCRILPQSDLPDGLYGEMTDRIYSKGIQNSWLPKNGSDIKNWRWSRYERVRPRFVNSGTLVGTRQRMQKLFNAAFARSTDADVLAYQSIRHREKKQSSDQYVFGETNLLAAKAGDPLVQVDTTQSLFAVLAHMAKEMEYVEMQEIHRSGGITEEEYLMLLREDPSWANRKVMHNSFTNHLASVLHLAGTQTKQQIIPIWQNTWLAAAAQAVLNNPAARLNLGARLPNGTTLGWSDMCSAEMLG